MVLVWFLSPHYFGALVDGGLGKRLREPCLFSAAIAFRLALRFANRLPSRLAGTFITLWPTGSRIARTAFADHLRGALHVFPNHVVAVPHGGELLAIASDGLRGNAPARIAFKNLFAINAHDGLAVDGRDRNRLSTSIQESNFPTPAPRFTRTNIALKRATFRSNITFTNRALNIRTARFFSAHTIGPADRRTHVAVTRRARITRRRATLSIARRLETGPAFTAAESTTGHQHSKTERRLPQRLELIRFQCGTYLRNNPLADDGHLGLSLAELGSGLADGVSIDFLRKDHLIQLTPGGHHLRADLSHVLAHRIPRVTHGLALRLGQFNRLERRRLLAALGIRTALAITRRLIRTTPAIATYLAAFTRRLFGSVLIAAGFAGRIRTWTRLFAAFLGGDEIEANAQR